MTTQGTDRKIDRTGLRALWLGLGSLLLTIFFMPLGIALGIAAIVFGIKARRRAAGKVPGALAGIIMGAIAAVMSTILLSMTVYLLSELSGYQNCVDVANTNTDEQACRDIWFPKMEKKLNMPKGSMSKYGNLF